MIKYPRTLHLSCSPGKTQDDKTCDTADIQKLIDDGVDFVITSKLDGGNCALKSDGVFARSHAAPTYCTTFDYVKNVHYYANLPLIQDDGLVVFGENLFAIHSIEYTNLKDYFYMFGVVLQETETFVDWDTLLDYAEKMRMPVVPVVYEGKIESLEWLENFINQQMESESALGGEQEGFVVRVRSAFSVDEFGSKVFKWVRRNHISTDEHWRKNWKQAKLNK